MVKNKVGQIVSMRLDGSDPRDFTTAGEGLPYGLALSPDGRRVLSGGLDRTLKLWDVETGRLISTFDVDSAGVDRGH